MISSLKKGGQTHFDYAFKTLSGGWS